MQVRYRPHLYEAAAQQWALEHEFGCATVAYDDCLAMGDNLR